MRASSGVHRRLKRAAREAVRSPGSESVRSRPRRSRSCARRIVASIFGRSSTAEASGTRGRSLTRERIRQIEAKALQKLRAPNRCEHLRAFIDG
ncbi:MAG: hypothetical protein EA398_11970 [Deltaproteobacteria bacterium]|nr:MAG: hypothetical protein EA398_11970 [Deltaproteobacteria bacterium]